MDRTSQEVAAGQGALAGYRVLELGRVLAAPWCGQQLADLGAEVIKVERPGIGDMSRLYGPDMLRDAQGQKTRESSFYLCANRNKKSITVDIAVAEGQALIRDLLQSCDVLIENFVGDTMQRYGLDYATISAINPRIVYCSITGYGHDGPYADRPGFDAVFQAQSGMMSITGLPDDMPGGQPMKTGPSLIDVMTGTNAALAIVAALNHRDRVSGRGQYIDMALLDSALACQSHVIANYLITGVTPERKGTVGNGGGPAEVFSCMDGYIYISCGSDQAYYALCDILGAPELATDPKFRTIGARWENREDMRPQLIQRIAGWPRYALLEQCVAASIPVGLVNDYDEAFADPQVQHRGLKVEIDHPLAQGGKIHLVRSPLRLTDTPVSEYRHPPLLGQDTSTVFGELLGIDSDALQALQAKGVI